MCQLKFLLCLMVIAKHLSMLTWQYSCNLSTVMCFGSLIKVIPVILRMQTIQSHYNTTLMEERFEERTGQKGISA